LPNTKNAKKAVKVIERRRVRNQSARSAVKTAFKKANEAVAKKGENAAELVVSAASLIDKTASRGIIHPNTAARKKSRLAKKLNKATAGA